MYACLSFAGAIPPLIQQLKSLLTSARGKVTQKASTAYVATALRNQATLQLFLDHAVESQLDITDVSWQARQSCVQLQHHLALKTQRNNIYVHKVGVTFAT